MSWKVWAPVAGGVGALGLAALVAWGPDGDEAVERSPGSTVLAYPSTGELSADRATPAPRQYFEEAPYDGHYTFIRVRPSADGGGLGSFGGFGRRGRGAPWSHDTPRAEVNFMKLIDELTFVDPNLDTRAARYLTLDDPEITRYPIIHLVEAGFWRPNEEEVEGLRNFLLKGGFMVLDDQRGDRDISNVNFHMQRVIPGAQLIQVPDDHRIFDTFFGIDDPESLTPPYDSYPPIYLGYFEDNDPSKRIMVMINHNNDHMEYWEFSDRGYYPIDLANDAYKFGINYIIYGMTY